MLRGANFTTKKKIVRITLPKYATDWSFSVYTSQVPDSDWSFSVHSVSGMVDEVSSHSSVQRAREYLSDIRDRATATSASESSWLSNWVSSARDAYSQLSEREEFKAARDYVNNQIETVSQSAFENCSQV